MKRTLLTLLFLAGTAAMAASAAHAKDSRGDNPITSASASSRRYFLVTEAGVRKIWMPTTDHMDQYIFVDAYKGVCYYPYYPVPAPPHLNGYLGVGFGGVPARVAWGAEAIGGGLLILILSGID